MDFARHKSSQKNDFRFNIEAEIAGQAEKQAEIFVNFEVACNKYSIV